MDSSIINLKNIRNSYFFKLEDDFRIELFQTCLKASTKWKFLAKAVGYSPERLRAIKNGVSVRNKRKQEVFVSKPLLFNLGEISGTTLEEIEMYISGIKKNEACKPISIKLPIDVSASLAMVIGHSFGDGSLRKNYFVYGNNELMLIKNMENSINKIFNSKVQDRLTKINKYDKEFYSITYPGTVSDVLNYFGAVLNSKLHQEFDVPTWIKEGDKQIKSSFVRALFDDESHVSKRDKNIIFKLSKEKNLENSLKQFLNSITNILKEFGIKANKVKKLAEYNTSKGENRIALGFTISGKDELSLYRNNIGFNHPKKIKDLNIVLDSYKLICYKPNEVFDKIITFLSNNIKTTGEVADYIKRDLGTTRSHLNSLLKKGKINKQSRGPTLWSLGG